MGGFRVLLDCFLACLLLSFDVVKDAQLTGGN